MVQMKERRRRPNSPDQPPLPEAWREPHPEERKPLPWLRRWIILNTFPAMKNINNRLNMLTSRFVV